jgi:hypothetical protein
MEKRENSRRTLTAVLLAWLCFGAASSQSVVVNNAEYKGKTISQLHFDGEEVTVKLNDGTLIGSVYQLSALIDKDAAVSQPDYEWPAQPGDGCYDLLGRRLGPGRLPAVYIERKGGKVKKRSNKSAVAGAGKPRHTNLGVVTGSEKED